MVAIGTIAFAVIAVGIVCLTPDGAGFLQPLDTALSAGLHVAGARPTSSVRWLSSSVLPAAAAISIAVQDRARPRQGAKLLAVTAGGGAMAWWIQSIVARPGPGHVGDLAASTARSFPSIAAAMTAALLYTKARSAPSAVPAKWRAALLGAAVAGLAAVPSLVTAAEWPTDVVAGVVVGLAVAQLGERPQPRHHRLAGPRTGLAALACAALLLAPVARSYSAVLSAPGSAPLDLRTIEWLRDHDLSSVVDRGESWWLWRHLPSTTASIAALPLAPLVAAGTSSPSGLPVDIGAPLAPPLPDEGRWTVAAVDRHGAPELATTSFRPDPSHPSLVAGVAWINSSNTRLALVAGTRQPGGGVGPAGGRIPDAARGALLAAFNSGYQMQDTPGGALVEGHLTHHLEAGLATLAVRPDGSATVGEWGTDLDPNDPYVAVRQNLHLLVTNGAPVAGVATNAGGRWGRVRNALPTWRSGIGVTSNGDLVYVAGNDLTLGVLADALVRAGATKAMELDIHRGMVTFNLFSHEPGLVGHKLLPDMTRPADRYLTPDWRDFVVVTAR